MRISTRPEPARYFVVYELPTVDSVLDLLATGDTQMLGRAPAVR